MKDTIEISGIWLRSIAKNQFEVLAEVDGEWAPVITEYFVHGNVVSHIVEPLGIRTAADRMAGKIKDPKVDIAPVSLSSKIYGGIALILVLSWASLSVVLLMDVIAMQ